MISGDRLDVPLQQMVRRVRLFPFHGRPGEDPISLHWIKALLSPLKEVFRHMCSCAYGDLSELTRIDNAGRKLLLAMHLAGVRM